VLHFRATFRHAGQTCAGATGSAFLRGGLCGGICLRRRSAAPPTSCGTTAPAGAAAVVVPELYDPTRWEVRFGGFAHGVGSVEKETWDLNGEIVVGSFFGRAPLGVWSPLIPRLHAGVNGNLSGRTSVVYAASCGPCRSPTTSSSRRSSTAPRITAR
jgi:hypothetical protein